MAESVQETHIRLPLLNKMLLASDHVGLQAIQYFRQTWMLFFLVPPLGEGIARVPDISIIGLDIDARVFAGFLITSGRFVDAFTDPLIGWWSDRTRSRWGRRIPFILFSTPFTLPSVLSCGSYRCRKPASGTQSTSWLFLSCFSLQ